MNSVAGGRLAISTSAEIITDDNLISEYKNGIRFGPRILQALEPPAPPKMSAQGL